MAKYTLGRRYRRQYPRSNYRYAKTFAAKPRYRKHFYRRRRPTRRTALQNKDNTRKYLTKNAVHIIMRWPIKSNQEPTPPITDTEVKLTIENIVHGNRQFDRNMRDYAWIKFNYIAFKVTDVAHIGYQTVQSIGTPPTLLPLGITGFMGTVPIAINWDVEQDFSFLKGHEGVVDQEGFQQAPGTILFKPGQKKHPSKVWHFPSSFRQFFSTDIVKNNTDLAGYIEDFIENMTGVKGMRCPKNIFINMPSWYSTLFPSDANNAAIKTMVRLDVYMSCTFRGRRTMDDGTCTMTSCA